MAYNDDSENNQNKKITSSDFLPQFYRTNANRKFLQATLDQLIQPGEAEKIQGYFGRKTAKAYKSSDNYIGDVSAQRENYQLEPSLVIKDSFDNVDFYKDYNDYIGQLSVFGANTTNHSRLNSQETYAWNPNVDWDKFVNFREYYWLPNGPQTIDVRGQSKEVVSTYTVTLSDDDDNTSYVFNDGFTKNPSLQLFRGQTYRFEVDVPGHPIAFAISRTFTPGAAILVAGTEGIRSNGLYDGTLYDEVDANYDLGDFIVLPSSGSVTFEDSENVSTIYPDGIRKFGEEGEEISTVYLENGIIEFSIPENAPDRLYYISKNDVDTSGYIKVSDIEENTFLDVVNEILGKKTYTSANGVEFSNGFKVRFQGQVTPEIYSNNEWYVEGVGDKIRLINDKDLIIPAAYASNQFVPFDTDSFDTLPFSNAKSYTADKDYIVVNRASLDRNAWTRYNKWFHKSVVSKSFEYNKNETPINEDSRAKRPIIEFEAGIKLFQFGSFAKNDVDLIDSVTTDVFSTIEGQVGYNVDGIELADNMRVLFSADTDKLVNGKIYLVKFITIGNRRQINLVEAEDATPAALETVLVTQGQKNAGKSYYYDEVTLGWKPAQEKTKVNQQPLFDAFGIDKVSFGDTNAYGASTFAGTKLFSYKAGTGANDTELGFPLTYRNISNSGDIVFEFNLLTDTFEYEVGTELYKKSINPGFMKKYKDLTTFEWINGFSNKPTKSVQKVIREYTAEEGNLSTFEIDTYLDAGTLSDLVINVFVNSSLVNNYTIERTNKRLFITFPQELAEGDFVVIKSKTSQASKNENGYYEFPNNLERNPKNEDFSEFTLGEVIDHVDTMVEDLRNFTGVYPGDSNLRDLGDIDKFGKRFVKHSGPINLSAYHVTNKNYNIVNALKFSRREYSRFKRNFIETAVSLGIDTETKQHVDLVLTELNKDKQKTQSFYFSDMVGYQAANVITHEVLDIRSRFYSLSEDFDLDTLSSKSVNVYVNGVQIAYGVDYNFSTNGFVNVFADNLTVGDTITIYEYPSTDGAFIPPTPTKLGLYPKFSPEIVYDDTYRPEAGESPSDQVAYKIYAQSEKGYRAENKIGWFYPLYTDKVSAESVDLANGGTGTAHKHMFNGSNIILYMPDTGGTHAGIDTTEFDAYPQGHALIRGHDGSYIRAYNDYRDNLLLDLEKRIFNNIKIEYNNSIIDVTKFKGGEFRKSEFTREEIDNALLVGFADWLSILDNDYTNNYFYLRQDEFTFNYSNMRSFNGNTLPGFWRGIYQNAFDTDRPHTAPWEMLGFTIKPTWWNTVYGPAPYTGDNLLLWEDLEEGKIAEPGNIRYNNNYARPGLAKCIPVDSKGLLKSPLRTNIIDTFELRSTTNNFSFGDWAPVETAWRRSSEYPFSLLEAMVLNKPAETIGLGFDLSRIQKNFANQYIYNNTSKVIQLEEILLPNTTKSNERIMTSGLVNYISNLISSNVLKVYDDYQYQLKNIQNQLGLKLAGFSDKDKLNVVLDSRSIVEDQSQSGVFIPQENYDVFLNTSSPTDLITYSGLIIEKLATGFIVRGYSQDNPYFEYYNPKSGSKRIVITVGGITETSNEWRERTPYLKGQLVENNGKFYRVTESFTSTENFEIDNLVILKQAPVVGGKTAEFDKNFSKQNVLRIPYGHKFATSQEVITFILGYSARLQDLGFSFTYTKNGSQIDDWQDSAKEFLFWTTQGWTSGTVITLSPSANRLYFDRDYHVVDDLSDTFYNYSIFDENKQPLDLKFNSILRDQNSFGIEVVGSDHGLYHVALPIVQKEHVVLFDNKTVFNDIIYQPSTGYRQDRLRINAYRTSDWQGGFNVPGFVFDDATYKVWEEYKDYKIGDLVKHRQFYYTATQNITGTNNFVESSWYRLSKEPEKKLLTNFDYKINQFMDFYDLDSAGFDESQQELAQHLVGYQKRQYLANIINDDVSQFKFYNGYIQDKGTINAVTKLFDSLSNNEEDKVQLFEEWAIQVGQYGATDNEVQLEYKLSDSKIEEAPQIFEITNTVPTDIDKIYRLLPNDVYDKPQDYIHDTPFPTTTVQEYLKTGGYVNQDDITFIAYDKAELAGTDINLIDLGSYIWLIETGKDDWTVYQVIDTDIKAISAESSTGEFTKQGSPLSEITLDKWTTNNLEEKDIIGILDADEYNFASLYNIEKANLNKIFIAAGDDTLSFEDKTFAVVKLREVRIKDISEINPIIQNKQYDDQRFWVDNYNNGSWNVLENNPVYFERQTIQNTTDATSTNQEFGENIAVTQNNRTMVVAAPNDENGKIFVYLRSRENSNFVINQEIEYPTDTNLLDISNSRFGDSVDISPDGEYIVVGVPNASGVKTRLLGNFDPDANYQKNDIINYRDNFWQALRTISPRAGNQGFSTFDNYQNLISNIDTDSTDTVLLVSGNPGLENSIADHILVRAPADMYLGTKSRNFTVGQEEAGDTVNLYWNKRSFANETLEDVLPFNESITQITPSWINSSHEIIHKVDSILEVETFISLPQVGDFVTTVTGRAEVVYVASKLDSAVIYVSNTNGIFDITGELYNDETNFIGLYTTENTYTTSTAVGGYWLIKTYNTDDKPLSSFTTEVSDSDGFTYNVGSNFYDVGRGLVYADVRLSDSDREVNGYYNIQDTISDIGTYVLAKNRTSYITQLSYRGDPSGQDGQDGTERSCQSDLFVVRVGKSFSDSLTIGDSYKFQVYDLENRPIDYTNLFIDDQALNKELTISDMWDGYIDFEFNRFDSSGFAFEPQPKFYHDVSGALQTRAQGDVIVDVQTASDGSGGLAVSSLAPTSAAEVVYLQRDFNKVRVYVKILDQYNGVTYGGNFDELNNIGKYELKRLASDTIRLTGDVDRVFGEVTASENSITLGTTQVGKLLVFENGVSFTNELLSWTDTPALIDEEYYFFNENTESGISIPANPPYTLNKDYRQIYNLPADSTGAAGPDNSGAIAIYRRRPDNAYQLQKTLTSFQNAEDREFGRKVRLIQTENAYTLLVGTSGIDADSETLNTGRRENPGVIEIFRHGTDDLANLSGVFQIRAYDINEIVIYKDEYYQAIRPVKSGVLPTDPIYWVNISWKYGKDSDYQGDWDNTYSYAEGNIVLKDNVLYKAITNIAANAEFVITDWEVLDSRIDYLGYLPNLTGQHLYDEDVFDPANISDFSQTFDISDDGQVLIVKALLVAADSYTEQRIAIYRQNGNKFQLTQVIDAPNETTNWGENVSLNTSGTQFAISASTNGEFGIDKGLVYVYKSVNGQFELDQTLQSPQNEVAEKFGHSLDFGSTNLIVSSLNGDQIIPTTFDNQETYFDGKFTSFRNVVLDKGVVYVYENIQDKLVYSENIIYPQIQQTFGEHLYSIDNHIYVGMPEQSNIDSRGQVVDFRRNVDVRGWNTLEEQVLPVDLNKISGITLYNKRTNEFISRLDYIDPLQGKVAGPAEQEIDYKVGFDPAVYNTGLENDFLIDPKRYWGKEHVGEIWWATNTARFAYPYFGTPNSQKRNWNKLLNGSSIDIFEWVESPYIPSVYDEFADTDKGLTLGISGISVYGNTRYSTQLVYDNISQTFNAKYYFWVQNKVTIPTNYKPKRVLNCNDIENLIVDPRSQGYKFVSLINKNKFILNNCNDLIQGDDVVIQFRYKKNPDQNINRHLEYQIVSEGLESSEIHSDIERKWYDSLIGFDINNNTVPDTNIPENKRYGVHNKPRQGMFKNRFEALKQVIERVNSILSQELLIDSYDLSGLNRKELEPINSSGKYDIKISSIDDLRFISTNKITPAEIELIISNGKIISSNIINPGRGYKVPPSYNLEGPGKDAILNFTINNLGQITDVDIESSGSGYLDTTRLVVRPFSVLVSTNKDFAGKWTIYEWNGTAWNISSIQDYDVSNYWVYRDWYAEDYNQFTPINYTVDGTYLLSSLENTVGSTVKIRSTGSGGWLLLQKTSNLASEDYTQNYKVIGRENGTVEFKDSLYNYATNSIGFDNRSFDSAFYDNNPIVELRIILETLRDNILIGTLKSQYNDLFFVSVRYLLAEQKSVDWLFKTSFVKAKYRVSELRNDVTFNSDKLQSFEEYLSEVKPYKTKIREYINVYNKTEPTSTSVTDFDLPPYYSLVDGKIIPNRAIVNNGVIQNSTNEFESYPRKHYSDNVGYEVTDIKVKDGGSGYTFRPVVNIIGDCTTPATAEAFLGYGKITQIKITNPGKGYLTQPIVEIIGSQVEGGTAPRISAILGNSTVRTPHIRVKFDRVSGNLFIETLAETETFTGSAVNFIYDLEWPMDLNRKKVKVTIDGREMLRSTYTYENVEDNTKTYTRSNGRITFKEAPATGSVIVISYSKPVDMLNAQDRIYHFYEAQAGMKGNDFSQLMKGIDYGGVQVTSYGFAGADGFDTTGWYTDTWDTFDNTFEDEIFVADGSTIAVQLSQPLESGVVYNLYKNGVRIDDPDFIAGTPTNVNAITNSITGDGTTNIIYVQDEGISLLDGDIFVVRKTTSDGASTPDATSFDTQLSGGDLPYATAKGVNAEEIVVDGDGFVNPITHAGPEEHVPGLVTDALDIKVYTRDSEGNGVIYSQNYTTEGTRTEYDLGTIPSTKYAIIVKLDDIRLSESDYTLDSVNNKIVFSTAPAANQELSIISQSIGTDALLDYGKIITDGSTTEVITTVDWVNGASVSATVDGEPLDVVVFNSDEEGYVLSNAKVGIRFTETILEDRVVQYAVFSNSDIVNYSRVITNTFTGTGGQTAFELVDVPFTQIPLEQKIIVKVGNDILNPGYNIKFTIPENNQKTYSFEQFQQPIGSLDVQELKVYLNGTEISNPIEFTYDVANASIILTDETGNPGDVVEIYAISDGDYAFGYLNAQAIWVDTPGTLHFSTAPALNDEITIYQFSNHDILGIERINYDVVNRATTVVNSELTTYRLLKSGRIALRKPATDAQYVWVTKNKELLSPSVDYYITDDNLQVVMTERLLDNDVIDILHFTAPVAPAKFAFRQFKDMLNRTHFKRLDIASTTLAQDLNYYDLRIEVTDGDALAEPNKAKNLPGIVFINGERIEYFVKEGNTLRQLRRATLGTGIKDLHQTGSKIYDQNVSKTIPYQDTISQKAFVADGVTSMFEPGFSISSINDVEVFVGGKRLRKTAIDVFNPTVAQDSPEGDTTTIAEFAVSNNTVELAEIPEDNVQVVIIKKTGSLWSDQGTQLALTENSIARFLRAGTSELPE